MSNGNKTHIFCRGYVTNIRCCCCCCCFLFVCFLFVFVLFVFVLFVFRSFVVVFFREFILSVAMATNQIQRFGQNSCLVEDCSRNISVKLLSKYL